MRNQYLIEEYQAADTLRNRTMRDIDKRSYLATTGYIIKICTKRKLEILIAKTVSGCLIARKYMKEQHQRGLISTDN